MFLSWKIGITNKKSIICQQYRLKNQHVNTACEQSLFVASEQSFVCSCHICVYKTNPMPIIMLKPQNSFYSLCDIQ